MNDLYSSLYTALNAFVDAKTGIRAAEIAELALMDNRVQLTLNACYRSALPELTAALQAIIDQSESALSLSVQQNILPVNAGNNAQTIPSVKNIIAVASGKGGVGKSTTAVNLALALSAEGARVGILDADIYGPSIPHMLGIADQRPDVLDGKLMKPIMAHGIQCMSMGVLVNENTPMVWRGPMASGALQQLLKQTVWDELDYLVIDMPPGTGDIQLTLSQSVPVTSSVIVTTPQDIALLDAKKGIEMFRKVNVPVAGIVENMATHICSHCGHQEAIFGEGGGQQLAELYDAPLLGQLPLALSIRKWVDSGQPPVVAEPDSPVSEAYLAIARRVSASILALSTSGQTAPSIEFADD